MILFLAGMARQAQAQSYTITSLWSAGIGTANLVNDGNNRGLAYNVLSNQVYIAGRTSAAKAISVLDGTSGAVIAADFPNISVVPYNVGVADDGVIYGVPLANGVGANNLNIYSWTNWNSLQRQCYAQVGGDATSLGQVLGQRVGDSFAIYGGGINTLIALPICMATGTRSTNNMLFFSTTDGQTFTPKLITISGLPYPTASADGGPEHGVAFIDSTHLLFRPGFGSSTYLIQFPANFASLTSPVAATVIATNTTLPSAAGSDVYLFSYSPGGKLLADYGQILSAAGSTALGLYDISSFPTANGLVTTNTPHSNANGNFTGGVALGGQGKTNAVYVLDSNNGVWAFGLTYLAAPAAPVINTQPAGATGVFPPFTLSVSAIGTAPLAYQWQATNAAAAGSFTNISGALTNVYTVTAALNTNSYRVVITNTAGSVTSSVVLVTTLKPVTNSAVSSLWKVAAGQSGYSYLTASSDGTRGIAYDTNSQRVVVSSTAGLYVLNGNTGANIETLSTVGVAFGGLISGADQVGIADDGAVYVGNVINLSGNFNLYRWSAPSNIVTATSAFSADPANGGGNADRWGDTMAVRGSGTGTQILLGSRVNSTGGGTNIAFLTTSDGSTYQSVIIAVSGVPAGFAGYGISFGAGNTFWAKSSGGDLFEIAFDTNALTGTVIYDYKAGSQILSSILGIGVDPVNNILAGITDGDVPHDLQLLQLTGTSDSPVLFNQAFFGSANANGNGNAVVTVKYPRIYGLDVDNGIVALTYGAPATTAPTINTPPASTTFYTNVPTVTLSVSASGSLPLYYQWRFNSNNITGANSSSYTITNPPLSKAGYYDVVVHNISGSITSTPPALLTLLVPVTSTQVTPLWSVGPGTNSSVNDTYLTTSGYETRGLAYDPIATNLLVADHYYVHVYDASNGLYEYDLSTAGFPSGGINGWTVDQLGVADDGTLYSANLSPDGTAFSIISYGVYPYASLAYAYGGATGAADLNTLDPAGDRWGDTMAVRGSGPGTQILFGSYNGTNVALFTTPDGVNFMPTLIAVQGGVPLGFASLGIAFGPGNTFYAKGGHNYNLREVSFDTNADTGTVLQSYTAGSQVPNDLTGLGVDVTNNVLGGVCYNDVPHDVQLYLLSGNANAPYLFEQDFMPASNPNSQENSVVTLKGGLGFALDVNNGIVAFSYSAPSAPAVTLTGVSYAPSNTVINWNNNFSAHGYQVQYKHTLLDLLWNNLGAAVTNSTATASFNDTTAGGGTRFYRVISQ